MEKILVVDDEAYRTRAYRENLSRDKFEVVYAATIDEAHELLNDPDQKFALLIQDLQMGRPLPDDKLTMSNAEWEEYNRLAGLWFLVKQRDLLISRRIPVAVLTQRTADEFLSTVTNKLQFHRVVVEIFRKLDTPADRFPAKIRAFLETARKQQPVTAR